MASLGLSYLESSDSDPEIVPESPPAMPSTQSHTQPITETLASETSTEPLFTFPLPPLNQQYRTPEEGAEALNTFARPYGYAVTIRRSKYTKKGIKKSVYLCCDRGREVKQEDTEETAKKRRTTTLACGCPFMIVLRLDSITGLWRPTIDDSKSKHNHLPSPASTHMAQRKLELTHKKDEIENALRQGRTTRQIMTEIHKADPESILTPRDIYNTRRKLSDIFLAGRTPLQALLIELPKDGSWIFKYELDEQSHVSALFCMHKSSVAMLQKNPWVISMDCTYKTNRYGLPLLDIVGFAATGSTFHLGFAFMRDEKDDSYEARRDAGINRRLTPAEAQEDREKAEIPFRLGDEAAPEVLGISQAPRPAAPRPAAPSNRSLPRILSHRIVLYTEILRHGRRAEDKDEDGRGDGEGDVGVE
ncbi:hypothetical protein PENNAL_c0329G06460 [Penicillium nalgiovense]|uniref:MULE transposase domain-containing protein n=1 Tax=Penicillium nalgiovense TaxID=60175 RepID=A0A1V6W8P2_PENNA|nr:hypothetical protein PENNAL_c0329G06460 [Penicillium nalgiovense]